MKQHIENTRRQIGELAAMAASTEAMERKILARAEELLSEIDGKISDARAAAMADGDDAKHRYLELIEERGRLHQVIASARVALGTT